MAAPLLRVWFSVVAILLSLSCAAQGSTPLLFEVKSPTTTLYLFGTIHVGTPAMYPLSAAVEQAFAHATSLALEADPTDQSASALAITRSIYRPPDNLERHIDSELFRALAAKLPQVGLPMEYARMLKPHLLAMTITMMQVEALGYAPALGLDQHFAQRAKRDNKPIVELESMAQQMDLFEDLPGEVQQEMLRAALEALEGEALREDLEALVAAWQSGDAEGIERAVMRELESMDDASARTLQQRVYVARNEAMAEKIRAMLAERTVQFVAVGAGHLTGVSSLPALLQAMGFQVRRL